jgi:hypothetical protein
MTSISEIASRASLRLSDRDRKDRSVLVSPARVSVLREQGSTTGRPEVPAGVPLGWLPVPLQPLDLATGSWSLCRPTRSRLVRLVAHVLIRLLVIGPLPPSIQRAALLFPASVLWPLIDAASHRGEEVISTNLPASKEAPSPRPPSPLAFSGRMKCGNGQ